MDLKKYLSSNYPVVKPFDGINSVEDRLLEHQYLVIIDEDSQFCGILIASDIIKYPHKLVIDCVTKKESLMLDDSISSVFEKFYRSKSFVLPLMDGSKFIGVIEKDRIIKELKLKVDELYTSSLISEKAKNNFLNNLCHEIRTPLNGILGFLDIVSSLDKDELIDNKGGCFDVIEKSADNFLRIMNDLVELSLLHAGDEVSIDKDNVDIVKILNELKDYFSQLLCTQNKKATLIYSNSETHLNIYTDEKKVKHILYHLIDNAIKFSQDNKVSFGFELQPDKRYINLFVKNNDPNINQKDLIKMLDVFEKQESIGEELNSGLGIGLPLVKKLTDLLGGRIEVKTKNKEISFIVNLPIY